MDEKELHAVEAHEDERLETHETEPQLDEIRGGYYAGMNRAFPDKAELYDQAEEQAHRLNELAKPENRVSTQVHEGTLGAVADVQCLHQYEHIEACKLCGDAFLVIDDVPYEANHPEVRTR